MYLVLLISVSIKISHTANSLQPINCYSVVTAANFRSSAHTPIKLIMELSDDVQREIALFGRVGNFRGSLANNISSGFIGISPNVNSCGC